MNTDLSRPPWETLVDLLQWRGQHQPDQCAYTFLNEQGTETDRITYGELDLQARAIGATLQGRAEINARVVLLFPPGIPYVAAFFGCLYAGAMAVPAYPPRPDRMDPRLVAMTADAVSTLALTNLKIPTPAALSSLTWIDTDGISSAAAESWSPPAVTADSPAFLQYTSGSTAVPKGVMLTHGNLLTNLAWIERSFGLTPHTRMVSWLPPYHDLGLIGGILAPLYSGFRVTLLSPSTFIENPLIWLQTISCEKADINGGPNFAYDLCVRRTTPEQRKALDLSSWELAFSGSEPIRVETLARFATAFEVSGFHRRAFYPAYGLAEATLMVTGVKRGKGATTRSFTPSSLGQGLPVAAETDSPESRTLVGCGFPLPDETLLIVHPESRRPCSPPEIGEVWLAGPCIAQGYWNRPEATRETFQAQLADGSGSFLRTGDLGFILEGELFLTGRIKDLIIIRGRNHYPQDIELTVEKSHPALEPGTGCAFSVDVAGEERLIVVCEPRPSAELKLAAISAAVRRAIIAEHEIQLHALILIRPGTIPKTVSGKIQRRICRQQYLEGRLELVGSSEPEEIPASAEIAPPTLASHDAAGRRQWLLNYLPYRAAQILRCPIEQIHFHDTFSALGLDSLQSVEFQHDLETALGIKLPAFFFLHNLTLAQLIDQILELRETSPTEEPIIPAPPTPDNSYPLAPGAEALWFLHQLAPESHAYTIAQAVQIPAPIYLPAFQQALERLVQRHPALRTTFTAPDGTPLQKINPFLAPGFYIEDVSTWTEAALKERLNAEVVRPFDLEHGPLLRLYLFRRADNDYVMLLTVHHMVADFWSLALLARELGELYPALCRNETPDLPPLTVDYPGYALWQLRELNTLAGEDLWHYWKSHLTGKPMVLDLPMDYPRPPAQTYGGATESLTLSPELTRALKKLGQEQGVTLYTTLLAAFEVLLYRYSGQAEFLLGSPTANRTRAELASLFGYCVNPVVLAADMTGNPTFLNLLTHTRTEVLEAFAHQSYPFERLVERLHPPRDISRSPIFQVLFTLQQSPLPELALLPGLAVNQPDLEIRLGGLPLRAFPLEQPTAQFDLGLTAADIGSRLALTLQYNRDLFAPATIRQMLRHLQHLLSEIVSAPQTPVDRLPLLPESERRQLLHEWNQTFQALPAEISLPALFERQASKTPEAVALVFEDQSLTYQELDRRATLLAGALRCRGVGPEVKVGIYLERSVDLVVALLGVLKAGGTYIPLDPFQPAARLALILEDARPALILVHSDGLDLPAGEARLLHIHDLDPESITVALPTIHPDQLAYIIYTSGSTGRPKGVQIAHRSVVNFLLSMKAELEIASPEVFLSLTTPSFDIAGLEIYLPLICGARVVMVPRSIAMDGPRLAARIASADITLMQATPATWQLLLDTGWKGRPNLKALCGGEMLPRDLATALLERVGRLWNMYGPTETTIWSALYPVTAGTGKVPIGYPLANTQLHVLDAALNPVPIGVVGELYIGGVGLGRGYFEQPGLTAWKFIPDPFAPQPGARLYRTGDLALRRPAGYLEFVGRVDFQVKIRGFRIELGEIETALNQYPGLHQALVIVEGKSPDESRLIAYLVPEHRPTPTSHEIRDFLKGRLPDYMIPSAFIYLDALPVTPNGKLDRQALPHPDTSQALPEEVISLPQSDLERRIAAIWQKVLQVESVSLYDNFFDLGGHSLLMARVHALMLRAGFPESLSMVDLFQYPTVQSLAQHLSRSAPEEVSLPVPSGPATSTVDQAIAIVGLACRFPGAADWPTFWENLTAGVESITFFSETELIAEGISPELLQNPDYVRASGALTDIDRFDAQFFGYSAKEAALLDPQHRLFLEQTWKALEDAGYNPETYPGRIGLFAGVSLNSYLYNNLHSHADLREFGGGYHLMVASDKDFLATRASYKLNLKGPSLTVQTACSTSLTAVHLACQSLRAGECEMALAGGASVRVPHRVGYRYHEGIVLSPTGHCRAFDARAQGTVIGNGVGVVVLKSLARALAEGDHIYAVIKGTALNNDGSLKAGYTAPSLTQQAAVIAAAQENAGVAPESITYVEAHGTGTPVGDPIEIAALTQAFRRQTQKTAFCALGSVKTNIGHLDAAAGIAGLIKTALMLSHARIPPSLNFEHPNPQIDFAHSPFFVNTELTPWEPTDGPRRAGLSSFGIGGTNVHAILEEAPPVTLRDRARRLQLFLLSAREESALQTAAERLSRHLEAHSGISLPDVAYTLQVGRKRFSHRRFVVAHTREEAIRQLSDQEPAGRAVHKAQDRPVAFMFTGQGAQYVNMALELYQTEPRFRETVDYSCDYLMRTTGLDLRRALYPVDDERDMAEQRLKQTEITQPVLFIVEYALAQLWLSWGIRPQGLIGHSLGEYVAACLAGVFSLDDALTLVAARGRLMQSLPTGAMLSISLSEADVQALLPDALSLATVNSPSQCVVSGPLEVVEAFQTLLDSRHIRSVRLQTSHAFHSAMMEPILAEFKAVMAKTSRKAPQIPLISNLTGGWITAAEATSPDYWADHLRRTVRFADGLRELLRQPDWILLEIGPETLARLALRHPDRRPEQPALASLRSAREVQSDSAFLLTTLGRLWQAGAAVDWDGFHAGEQRRRLPLPTYPFQRERYWIEPQKSTGATTAPTAVTPARRPPDNWFYAPSWQRMPVASFDMAALPERWLIFGDPAHVGSELERRLEAAGRDTVRVWAGPQFQSAGDRDYTVQPDKLEDYLALLRTLKTAGWLPDVVISLWDLTDENLPGWETGFYRHFYLLQALGRQITSRVQLLSVTNGTQAVWGTERLSPEKAVARGPLAVAEQEYPQLQCRSVDLVYPSLPAELPALVEQILVEVTLPPAPVVAYRGSHRWLQSFISTPLVKPALLAARLKNNGVYLVTGGLGGIGLALAQRLFASAQARLILVDALTPVSDSRKAHQVQQLLDAGAELLIEQADVTDATQMQGVVARSLARFGRIDGVFHAAGAPGGGAFALRTPDQIEKVMAPKVNGTLALDAALEGISLDFLVLFSSINAVVARAGQVDYYAANAFLDAFAQARNHRHPGSTLSINWETWRQIGMAAELAARQMPALTHPLLGNRLSTGSETDIYSLKLSPPRDWLLYEHGVVGKATLPGTTYLEMAWAAFAQSGGTMPVEFQDVYFLTPLILENDEEREVHILLERQGSQTSFSIMSRRDPEETGWYEHARGKIVPVSAETVAYWNLAEIEARCTRGERIDPLSADRMGAFELKRKTLTYGRQPDGMPRDVPALLVAEAAAPERRMAFGPHWYEGLKWVKLGDREGLAGFTLPEFFAAEWHTFTLHPALLDFATSFLRLFQSAGSYLPLAYRRLRLLHPLTGPFYSYVRYQAGQDQEDALSFDVAIFDAATREILIEISGFSVMKVEDVGKLNALSHARPAPPALSRIDSRAGGEFYRKLQQELDEGLATEEGLESLERILNSRLGQVIVSPRALEVRLEESRTRPLVTIQENATASLHSRPALQTPYASPQSKIEQHLVEIWQAVLGVAPIGIHDNFFELGGDSLLVTQIHSRIQDTFGKELSIAALLQNPTIARLQTLLTESETPPGQNVVEEIARRSDKQKAAFKKFGRK